MRITDGNSMFHMTLREFVGSQTYLNVARMRGIVVPPITKISTLNPTQATVNNGRLIAPCTGCVGGAEYIWRGGPYQMYCANCGNRDIGNNWRRIIMPEDRILREVERLLLMRTDPGTQNWNPTESIQELVLENLNYGVGV